MQCNKYSLKLRLAMGIMISSIVITGCSAISTDQARDKVVKELEPYNENEKSQSTEENYKYMENVSLGDDEYAVNTYLPKSDNLKTSENEGSSSKDGVSVTIRLYPESETTAGSILEDSYKKEKERIDAIQGMQNFKAYDLIEKEEYWLLEMDYSIIQDSSVYPCITVLKLDQLDSGYYLLSTITIDNSKANEETTDVLKELLDVYGVSLK